MLNVPSNNLSLVLDEVSKLSDHEVIVVGGNEPQLGKNVENILLRNVLKILSLLISHLDVGADIRGRFKSFKGSNLSYPSDHDTDHRQINKCLGCLWQ